MMTHREKKSYDSFDSSLNFSGKYYTVEVYRKINEIFRISELAALAQLVEHPHGKGKVMGSCPIGGSISS